MRQGPGQPSAEAAAARSLPRAPKPKGDGWLARVRPLLAAVAGLALGVACGQWLISRLADRLPPAEARAAAAVEAAGRTESAAPSETSKAGGANEPAPTEAGKPAESGAGVAPADAAGPPHASRPGAAVEAGKGCPPANEEGARRKEADAAPPATPAEAHRKASAVVKNGGEPAARRGGRCALSLSAGSLSLRAGGSGTVTAAVDDLAGRAAVNASTRHWPDIAVFKESAGGGRARYTVISASRRPGTYAVNFQSPCGAKTLHVNVK